MKHILIFFVFSTFSMIMCKSEVSVENAELTGNWKVVNGERNGQSVNYFSGFFIQFQEGNRLLTNINSASENENGEYQLDKNKISQQTASGTLIYDIESFEDSSMTVLTKMNGHDLKFVLKKGS